MFLFGATFYVVALAPVSLRPALWRRFRAPCALLAALALASAIGWFVLITVSMSGEAVFDPRAAGEVLTETQFGRVWAMRLALLLALTGLCALGRLFGRWGFAVSALTLATLALTGHAAMQQGALGAAHHGNDALHLLLTAGWLGGLPLSSSACNSLGARTHATARWRPCRAFR